MIAQNINPIPSLEIADIIKQYGREYIENRGPTSTQQRRVLKAIQLCRTSALGGHVLECDRCGHQDISYNSCRNIHCPKCQAAARAQWLEKRQCELLPVEYFHIVFTIPEEFRLIALQNKKNVYGILFRAAAETMIQIAKDPKHLGAKIGFFGILHTWGQNLLHHPHIHFVVPGGGLSADKTKWISSQKGFFLPLKVLRIVFRGKFIDFLKRAFSKDELVFFGDMAELAKSEVFEAKLDKASKHEWTIYVKPPFGGPKQVLKYLARYTHRVAISNKRLISIKDDKITFKWKDYADHNRKKIMTLNVFEFIRRFLLHVMPPRFTRIRYYGLLSSRNRKDYIELSRKLLTVPEDFSLCDDSKPQDFSDSNDEWEKCPVCKKGSMKIIEEFKRVSVHRAIVPPPKLIDTS